MQSILKKKVLKEIPNHNTEKWKENVIVLTTENGKLYKNPCEYSYNYNQSSNS